MDKNSDNAEQVEEIVQEIQENKDEKLGGSTTMGASTLKDTKKITPIVPEKVKTPPPVRRTRIVKRTVFFQGNAFVIEEEISIDSDEEESVFTSEDDFQEHND